MQRCSVRCAQPSRACWAAGRGGSAGTRWVGEFHGQWAVTRTCPWQVPLFPRRQCQGAQLKLQGSCPYCSPYCSSQDPACMCRSFLSRLGPACLNLAARFLVHRGLIKSAGPLFHDPQLTSIFTDIQPLPLLFIQPHQYRQLTPTRTTLPTPTPLKMPANTNIESMEMSQQPNMAAQAQMTTEQPVSHTPTAVAILQRIMFVSCGCRDKLFWAPLSDCSARLGSSDPSGPSRLVGVADAMYSGLRFPLRQECAITALGSTYCQRGRLQIQYANMLVL